MSRNRRSGGRRRQPSSRSNSQVGGISARAVPGANVWELVHPPGARERMDDIAEVRRMIEAGEYEIAQDELRWLLAGCGDFIEAHRLLGELALLDHDLRLARGHFGYGFELGVAAADRAGTMLTFPYTRPANQALLECGKGLAHCLSELSKPQLAQQVLRRLLQLDPTDPLNARQLLSEFGT